MTKTSKKAAPKAKSSAAAKSTTRKGMTYTKLSQDQKRSIIASRKRRGDGAVVAAKLGVTTTYVSNVITGRVDNTRVVNRMYDMVRGRKATA